jgi:hypothetical protein
MQTEAKWRSPTPQGVPECRREYAEEAKRLRAIAGCIYRLDRGVEEAQTKAYYLYVEDSDDETTKQLW